MLIKQVEKTNEMLIIKNELGVRKASVSTQSCRRKGAPQICTDPFNLVSRGKA